MFYSRFSVCEQFIRFLILHNTNAFVTLHRYGTENNVYSQPFKKFNYWMPLAFSRRLWVVSVFLDGNIEQWNAESGMFEYQANRSYISHHGVERLFDKNPGRIWMGSFWGTINAFKIPCRFEWFRSEGRSTELLEDSILKSQVTGRSVRAGTSG
jgi:hypothetical protein